MVRVDLQRAVHSSFFLLNGRRSGRRARPLYMVLGFALFCVRRGIFAGGDKSLSFP